MGAVLAAAVHAPLASILIVFELTQDYKVMLPAMLACVVATTTARLIFPDSIYTQGLRRRGLNLNSHADMNLLRRLSIEQVALEPAVRVHFGDAFQKIIDLSAQTGAGDFVVVDGSGQYLGMIVAEDIRTVLMQREAIPLLTCGEVMRTDVPVVKNTDDMSTALAIFAGSDVSRIPMAVTNSPEHVVGLVSRAALMRRYQQELLQPR
jgi:CIC family chloride channel protein